jgi:hypothetical protein
MDSYHVIEMSIIGKEFTTNDILNKLFSGEWWMDLESEIIFNSLNNDIVGKFNLVTPPSNNIS